MTTSDATQHSTGQPREAVGRRGMLAGLGLAAGSLAAACAPAPGAQPGAPPRVVVDSRDPAVHAARRLSYGPTPELVAEIRSMGVVGWVDSQLALPASVDAELEAQIASVWPYARGSFPELVARGEPWMAAYQLPTATSLLAVASKRQLIEMLAAAWWDTLSLNVLAAGVGGHSPSYDKVLRDGMLGRFSDLLVATARSAAMLNYLNQAASRADGGRAPNENYAREVLELHTVGVGAGYTNNDVTAVAYLLSGWAYDSTTGQYAFRAGRHQLGPFSDPGLSVLGWSRGSLTGAAAGEAFLRHLAAHPLCAQRLAWRFCVRFVGEHIGMDHPVVARAAKAYLDSDTGLVPMYKAIFSSAEFSSSVGRRVKRPLELIASMLRGISPQVDPGADYAQVAALLNGNTTTLGQMPHRWAPPNGYPDTDAYWAGVGALVGRWNMCTRFAYGGPGWAIDEARLRSWSEASTYGSWLDDVAVRFSVVLDTAVRDQICSTVGRSPTGSLRTGSDRWVLSQMLASLFHTEKFQVR